ncbi:MAG: tyrosine-type recombinase/integrase [Methanospirillum sp.]|uniref:site-specific integrase n=1 Tax=Methanospirillum sp. TaxID=45200 RepID=UPI00236B916D|nr:site-specific integrase [Methanospirillum sp.]MDD1728660.1 tyrosine-type recombinase/integrase [Methanospirillum sp.]
MIGNYAEFYSCKESPHSLEKALKRGAITERDRELIDGYISEMQALHQLSNNRVMKLITTLLGWRNNKLLPEYAQVTMPDLFSGIQKLSTANNTKGVPFAQNTKYDYVVILKRFLLWMIENELITTLNEKKIRDIRPPSKNQDTTHPDEILNPEEIAAMISACRSSRDRALIAVQYEAATRIGELGRLKWRDVLWDEYGAQLRIIDTKTNRVRQARLTTGSSSKYLAAWKADYPKVPEGEAYVFISERSDLLSYWGVLRIFKEAAARAGIKKKITTHLFRKSRGTHLIEQGLPIASVVELMWGNQNTKQIRTYIRMSPIEQDRILLKHAGVITEAESKAHERRLTGILCINCHTQNSPTAKYCDGCGVPLTEEAMRKRKAVQDLMSESDVILEMAGELEKYNHSRR